jgi:hypothetical protein
MEPSTSSPPERKAWCWIVMSRSSGGQSRPGGMLWEKGPQRRRTATGVRRERSFSITALTKS